MCFALRRLASESIHYPHTPKISVIFSCSFNGGKGIWRFDKFAFETDKTEISVANTS